MFETLLLYALTGEPPQIVDGPHASEILGEDLGNLGLPHAFSDEYGRGSVAHLVTFYFFCTPPPPPATARHRPPPPATARRRG